MAVLPAVGAVAGVVGQVAQAGAAGRQARNQRAALDEQNRQLTEQHKLLLIQRGNQRAVAQAETLRARQVESLASNANLFTIALQEQAAATQAIAEQLDQRAAGFQVEQQRIGELSAAYGSEMETFNQLFQQMGQAQAGQNEISQVASEAEGVAASSGQSDTQSSQALAERIALDADTSFQQSNQLFEMLQAQSLQNIQTTEQMAELQAQLGRGDVDLSRLMSDFNRSAGLMQLGAQRDATLLESQMNNAAIDEELAAQMYAIETAQSADSMNIQGAQRLNSIQRQGARGPGLFEMLPGLTQAGLGVYSAFNPPSALPARNLNPLYNAPGGTSASNIGPTSFDTSRNFGSLPRYQAGGASTRYSGFAPSLFNIG